MPVCALRVVDSVFFACLSVPGHQLQGVSRGGGARCSQWAAEPDGGSVPAVLSVQGTQADCSRCPPHSRGHLQDVFPTVSPWKRVTKRLVGEQFSFR